MKVKYPFFDKLFSSSKFTSVTQASNFVSKYDCLTIFSEFNTILNEISTDDELFIQNLLTIEDEFTHKIDMLISSLAVYSSVHSISEFQNLLNLLRNYITKIPKNPIDYTSFIAELNNVNFENEKEIVRPLDTCWDNNGVVWKITSDDGSFEMTMKPEYDNYTMLRFLVVGNLCHQVFGKWSGTVKCGDEVIEIKDMTAFLERSDNMW